MDTESRPTEFNVREKIGQFSTLLSRTIICFYQFLASDSESECPRRRLLDEYVTVGGAANSTKILLDNNDECSAEGYLERRRKIERLWAPGGALEQFAARMEGTYKIMSKAIEDHKRVSTHLHRRGPFPLSLEALNEEIRLVQEYKRRTADALYDDFYRSHKKLDPKIQLALDIIEWIGFIDTTEGQEFMSRERHEGTCQWMFDQDVCKRYHEWQSTAEGFLWIRGKAGSGKSVILAAIVDRIFKELWDGIGEQERRDGYRQKHDEPSYVLPGFFPAFYFFDFRDSRSLKTSTFLKSLFVQFLQAPDPDLLMTFPVLVRQYLDGLPPPADMETYQDLVLHALRLHEKKAIIVDGLNECDDVAAVMGFLDRLMQEANVRVLVASRPDPGILARYRRRPTIDLEDFIGYTTADMREWLMKRMMDHPRLGTIPHDRKIEVLDGATNCAAGSFWHAQCVVDSLDACRSVAQVNTVIYDAPRNLDVIHYDLLRRTGERGGDVRLIVSRAIRWLGGALRPMSLSQVIEAVQIELGRVPPLSLNDDLSVVTPDDMMMLCGNLVKIDARTARLSLGHSTVRAFLTRPVSEDETFSMYFFDPYAIHKDLALRSITYLMADDIEKAIRRSYTQTYMFEISRRHYIIDRCPMLTYVFDGGFEHLRYYTQQDDDAIDLLMLLEDHVREKPDKFREILQALHDRTESAPYQFIVEEKELALAILVRYGLPWMLKRYLLRRRNLAEGEEKEKLIKWAEKIGRCDHRDMLVGFELPELVEEKKAVSGGPGRDECVEVGEDSLLRDVVMADEQ